MPRRHDIDPRVLARVRRGELTRSNTRRGTPERQAVDRSTYLRRKATHPGLTARQALGHAARADVLPSISAMIDHSPRFVVFEGLGRRDTRRAARYGALVGQLSERQLSPAAFRRRVSSWRPISGYRFLADPDAVLAILERRRAEDRELFYYASGRAT